MNNQKMILLWVGDKHFTFGTANKKTGKRSLHGDFKRFKTVDDRADFMANYIHYSTFACYKCTVNTGRKYALGRSVAEYNEDLNMLDYQIIADD